VSATDRPRSEWHEAYPERLDWELEEFRCRGLPTVQRLGMADGRSGDCLVIETDLPFRGGLLPLSVVFPFEYPAKSPTIFGPSVLPRHQQPAAGNFCVLEFRS